MSIRLMCAAFDADVPATQKLVLLALCDNANDQGQCFPSIALLQRKCSLSDRAIQNAIAWLEEQGYLSRTFRTGSATLYVMTPERAVSQSQPSGIESHYVYRVTDVESGEFYIGVRTCFGPVGRDSA